MRPIPILTLALTLACGKSVVEPATQGDLRIELPSSAFTITQVTTQVITATVRNTSAAPQYTRAQDGFGNVLLTASGSDAAIERLGSDGRWTALQAGIAIEGVAIAVLPPNTSRELWVDLSVSPVPGTYRIRLAYGAANPGGTGSATSLAYSSIFTLR
jgi:hypothetical protein